MPDTYYWDACVYLSFINGTDQSRISNIKPMLENAEKDAFEIVTSTVSIAEVSFAAQEKSATALDQATEDKIGDLWVAGGPTKLVEFHQGVAEDARGIIRYGLTNGWSLKPLDAVHLATAQNHGVDEFHTYDDALNKYASFLGFPIREPETNTPQLPTSP